jgi:predicted anti-sigma-YlaC factor YlaD
MRVDPQAAEAAMAHVRDCEECRLWLAAMGESDG